MPYYVSRQRYWPDGVLRVEIAGGGMDYANPDQITVKYSSLGEGCEYSDPVDAVEAAIAVCKAWRKDTKKGARTIQICHGHTLGYTMYFDPCTFKEGRSWAIEERKRLPKCPYCGCVVGEKKWRHSLNDEPFCSEDCADSDFEFQMKEDGADLEGGEG